jgi:hypothetical protein
MSEKPGQVSGLGRRALLRNTLIAGAGAIALGAMSTTLAGAAEAAAGPGYQDNWGWCNQCNEIFWAGTNFEDAGVCPANDALYPHTLGGTNYTALTNFSTSGNPADTSSSGQQAGWRWCSKCSALVWNGNDGLCPGNSVPSRGILGNHVLGSTNYAVPFGISSTLYQNGWDYCSACGCLYWANGWDKAAENCYAANTNNGPHTPGSDTHYQFYYTY